MSMAILLLPLQLDGEEEGGARLEVKFTASTAFLFLPGVLPGLLVLCMASAARLRLRGVGDIA